MLEVYKGTQNKQFFDKKLQQLEREAGFEWNCATAVGPLLEGITTRLMHEILTGERPLEKDQEGFDHQLS